LPLLPDVLQISPHAVISAAMGCVMVVFELPSTVKDALDLIVTSASAAAVGAAAADINWISLSQLTTSSWPTVAVADALAACVSSSAILSDIQELGTVVIGELMGFKISQQLLSALVMVLAAHPVGPELPAIALLSLLPASASP
jgi:hypothetical protein